jgi:hypothetical protein
MTPPPFTLHISQHAVLRWQERVERDASWTAARLALGQFVSRGRIRPTPRHWTDVDPSPGLRFLYCAERPNVCALVMGGTVITVLTRELSKKTAPHSARALRAIDHGRRAPSRRRPVERAWQWDGLREAE